MKDSFTFSQVAKIATGVLLVAIVLLIVGTTASTDSLTSFIIAAGIIGLVATILLGRKIWWLLILSSLFYTRNSFLMTIQSGGASLIVLPFMGALAVLGRIKLKWNKYWPLDLLILALFAIYIQSLVRHPVGFLFFEGNYVGGKGYILFLVAVLSYVANSLILTDRKELCHLARWCFVAILIFSIVIPAFYSVLVSPDDISYSLEGGDEKKRYSGLQRSAQWAITLMLCRYSWTELLTSFWRLPLVLGSLVMILVSGFRVTFVENVLLVVLIQWFRKKIWSTLILFAGCFAVLVVFSESGVLKEKAFPGVQRSLAVFPFIKIEDHVRADAKDSKEWRIRMWKLATQRHIIRDEIWGDGLAYERSKFQKRQTEEWRAQYHRGQKTLESRNYQLLRYLESGGWHNSYLECIQRIGYVGCAVCVSLVACMVFILYRACKSMLTQRESFIFMSIFLYTLAIVLGDWLFSVGTLFNISMAIPQVGFAKLVYVTALREGLIEPLWSRQQYVPLLMRENARALPQVSGHLDK